MKTVSGNVQGFLSTDADASDNYSKCYDNISNEFVAFIIILIQYYSVIP